VGTSTSGAQLRAKLSRFAADVKNNKAALNATGMAGKDIFISAAASAGVLGKKPKDKRKLIGARYDLARGGNGVTVFFTGPAHLVNNPTRPHRIEPRKARGVRTRRRGASALTINGDVRAWANHPGTKGKHFAAPAIRAAAEKLPGVYNKAGLVEPLRRAFH
jgi:hypothetical protein